MSIDWAPLLIYILHLHIYTYILYVSLIDDAGMYMQCCVTETIITVMLTIIITIKSHSDILVLAKIAGHSG